MRKYDTIHEVKNLEEIINQYHYTTALDTFLITITKETLEENEYKYNAYVSRLNYGLTHHVLGIQKLDFITLKDAAIDYIQYLEKEIADGNTDC